MSSSSFSWPSATQTGTFGGGNQTNLFGFGANQYGAGWPTMNYPSAGSYGQLGEAFGMRNAGMQSGNAGYQIGTSYSPQLTSDLFGYLQSQIGQGLPAYPGQLTAPPVDIYNQLSNMLSGQQSNLPFAQQMMSMAQTGNPISVTPEWQAMLQSMQQPIAQQRAQLQESMGAGGNLVGTPYGNTMANFGEQVAANQNALLGQLQTQALEAAAGREAGMQQFLTGQGMQLGGQLQNINQLAASNAYNEWLRQQPAYNPLLGYQYGAATTFPPYLNPQASPWLNVPGAILQNIHLPSGTQNPNPTPNPGPNPNPSPQPQPGSTDPGLSPNWPSWATPPFIDWQHGQPYQITDPGYNLNVDYPAGYNDVFPPQVNQGLYDYNITDTVSGGYGGGTGGYLGDPFQEQQIA